MFTELPVEFYSHPLPVIDKDNNSFSSFWYRLNICEGQVDFPFHCKLFFVNCLFLLIYFFFSNFILIYKLNIQIKTSLHLCVPMRINQSRTKSKVQVSVSSAIISSAVIRKSYSSGKAHPTPSICSASI